MKKLLLIWFFSGSLDGHSQARTLEYPGKLMEARIYKRPDFRIDTVFHRTPDTLRAIILVTLSQNGTAHARMGYVVIEQGKRPVYLDCRKRALKLPQVGWGWEKLTGNIKLK
jgi:hypothetical protein